MAVRFDASGEEVTKTTIPADGTFTAMAWCRWSSFPAGFHTIFAVHGTGSVTVYLNDSELEVFNESASATGSTLSTGVWYHIAFVSEGSGANQLKAYLNGALDITGDSMAISGSIETNIGHYDQADYATAMEVCHFKEWDVALTLDEILAEMRVSRPVKPGAIAFAPFLGDARDFAFGGDWTVTNADYTVEAPPVPWGASARQILSRAPGANVTYRSSTVGEGTTYTPSGSPEAGDLMVILYVGFTPVTIPVGWTRLNSELVAGLYCEAAYRVRQGGDGASYSGWTSGAFWVAGIWYGNDVTDPVVDSNFALYNTDVNIPLPSLTASEIAGDAGAYIILGESAFTFTAPGTYQERLDTANSQTVGDRLNLGALQATSGTVVSSSTDTSAVLHLVIRSSNLPTEDPYGEPYDHEGVKPFSSVWRAGRF